MAESILEQLANLQKMSIPELRKKYAAVFEGRSSAVNNKAYLVKRIGYRLQELEYGGISGKAQEKIKELIQTYDPINIRPAKAVQTCLVRMKNKLLRDIRLPIPGTVITKIYKGKNFQVKALVKGFEYNGKTYNSLSSIANEITGDHWNGFIFFGLRK